MVHQSSRKTTFFPPRKIVIKLGVKRISAFKEKNFLQQKYVIEGLSINQIVSQTMSSRATVKKYLMIFGIEIRENDKSSGRPQYGQKRQNGILVPNRSELEVVDKIWSLKERGFSNQKIAEILESMDIPAKRRGKWSRGVVHTILRRGCRGRYGDLNISNS